jgi:hypothetical protein
MALYSVDLTVPPNTPESAPVQAILNPGVGTIVSVEILFPNGCLGAVGIRIMEDNRQFAPLPFGWLFDNNRAISWKETKRLAGPPYRITVQGISNASDWPHTVSVRMEII